jgi:uncharacterized protein YgiM (DUF1202 family)
MKKSLSLGLALLLVLALAMPAFAAPQQRGGEGWEAGYAEAYTTASRLNLRTGPGMSYSIARVLRRGTALTVWGYNGAWARVTTAAGKSGWVHSRYIGIVSWQTVKPRPVTRPSAPREEVVSRVLPQANDGGKALTGMPPAGGNEDDGSDGNVDDGNDGNDGNDDDDSVTLDSLQSAIDTVIAAESASNGNNNVKKYLNGNQGNAFDSLLMACQKELKGTQYDNATLSGLLTAALEALR